MYWRDGILKANFYGSRVFLRDGVVRVLRTLPAKVVASRPGKRLGRLVRYPHLSPDLIVTASSRALGDATLTVDIPVSSFSI